MLYLLGNKLAVKEDLIFITGEWIYDWMFLLYVINVLKTYLMKFPKWVLTLPTNACGLHCGCGCVLQKVATSQAPLCLPRCPAIASPPVGACTRKETAGTMAVVTATATPDGRCVCSYPALYPPVLIQLSSLTSVALHVRVCMSQHFQCVYFYIQC